MTIFINIINSKKQILNNCIIDEKKGIEQYLVKPLCIICIGSNMRKYCMCVNHDHDGYIWVLYMFVLIILFQRV